MNRYSGERKLSATHRKERIRQENTRAKKQAAKMSVRHGRRAVDHWVNGY